jgi:Copine
MSVTPSVLVLSYRKLTHSSSSFPPFFLQKKAQREGQLSYTILLILTAGNDENIQETKRELIEASSGPLSVVIVGIGDADFSAMELLDEHDSQTERGRDITKFVAFNEYDSYNDLTSAVLDEIPDQLVDFYFEKGILPPASVVMEHDEVKIMPADDDERTVNFLG